MSKRIKVYLDTEFTDLDETRRDLISIGLVAESGREFYAERNDFNREWATAFVRQIVLPKLGRYPDRIMPRNRLRDELREWLLAVKGESRWVEIGYDYLGDWQLMRAALDSDVPGWLTYTNVASRRDDLRIEEFFTRAAVNGTQEEDHHALYDARALRFAVDWSK